jgi:hypothetical protein
MPDLGCRAIGWMDGWTTLETYSCLCLVNVAISPQHFTANNIKGVALSTNNFRSYSSVSRLALGPTQPPVQWVPGILSPGVKRGRGVTLTINLHLVPRS